MTEPTMTLQQAIDHVHVVVTSSHLPGWKENREAWAIIQAALRTRGEAVAWRHTMHMEGGQQRFDVSPNSAQPFGVPGKDFDPSYHVTTEPLYTAPPAPRVDEAMVERACELSWPVAKFGMEPSDWNQADPMRRSHHKRVVRAALTAALENRDG